MERMCAQRYVQADTVQTKASKQGSATPESQIVVITAQRAHDDMKCELAYWLNIAGQNVNPV